jgi:hypothetical protein
MRRTNNHALGYHHLTQLDAVLRPSWVLVVEKKNKNPLYAFNNK